ncbi:MAG: hypothetical protein IKO40_05040 [Kiritimatiellae bacterium]|nr:hypothetical protein [Kiritimatiellia bacterium]
MKTSVFGICVAMACFAAGAAMAEEGNEFFEPPRQFEWFSGTGEKLTIPAPEGFLSVKGGTVVAEFFATIASADPNNTMLVNWVELCGDEISGNAYVNESNALRGKRITLAEFSQVAETLVKSDFTDEASFDKVSKRAAENANGYLREIGAEEADLSISGPRQLPAHRRDAERVAFTIIMNVGSGDEAQITANSCCVLWLRGHLLYYYVAQYAKSADALDKAIAESRRKLDAWCDAVVAANRSGIGASSSPDVEATILDQEIKEERSRNARGSERSGKWHAGRFFGRIVICGLVGGLWGLIISVFRRKG